jgi:hypothetical protein
MVGVHAAADHVFDPGWLDRGAADLLADRGQDLQRLRELLDGLRSGRGAAIAIVGEPGMGRSAVLRRTVTLAADRGIRVAVARGSLDESTLRYGVVQQLLASLGVLDGPLSTRLRQPAGTAQDGEPALTAELCRDLLQVARESPLAILIDDVQWVDSQSWHWLQMLYRRVRDAPVLLVAAVTSGLGLAREWKLDGPLAFDDRSMPLPEVIKLRPLSVTGVRAVLEAANCGRVDQTFVEATTRVTRGNPAVLHAVLRHFHRDRLAPSAAHVAELEASAAEAVGDQVARVMDGLPDELVALLRAVAVCDRLLPTDLVCRLAGLRTISAARAVSLLRAGGLVLDDEPLALAHPAAGRRILAGLPPPDRQKLHAEAAELGYRTGLADEQIAKLLLGAHRIGARWAANVLRSAAAGSRGVHGAAAIEYLRRALPEPLDEAERAQVLVELGAVEVLSDPEASDFHLGEAVLTPGSTAVMPFRLRAIDLLLARGSTVLAQRLTALAWDRLPTAEKENTSLLAVHWLADVGLPLRANRVLRLPSVPPVPVSPTEPAQAAFTAWQLAVRGVEPEYARKLARAALSSSISEERLLVPQIKACHALAMTDDVEEALAGLDRVLLEARRRKMPVIVGRALGERASIYLWCGRLTEAASDLACMAEEISSDSWHPSIGPPFTAFEVLLRLELGEVDRAEQLVADAFRTGEGNGETTPLMLFARGALRLTTGDAAAAVSDLEECGRGLRAKNVRNPSLIPWRRLAAMARHACGDVAEAQRLASAHFELARKWGTASALGDASLTRALVVDDKQAEGLLTAAVNTLEGTPPQCLYAYAVARLAAVQGAAGKSASAAALLRQAVKVAELHGATRLRGRITAIAKDLGVDSVVCPPTDLEDRVIEFARRGLSNRMIAAGLSVTQRTVEGLLASAYRKLGIKGRDALPAIVGNEV